MRHFYREKAPVLSSIFAALLLFAGGSAMGIEEGDKAPDFSLQSSDGKTYSLSEFTGVRPVVIAFFPKAFTGG
jgi:peroxiredoxin Q/BCP